MNKASLLIGSALLCNLVFANSQTKDTDASKLVRSLTLTPGYMERTFNSNEMMKHGPLSLMQLSSQGIDALANLSDNPWIKGGIFAALGFPNYLVSTTSSTVYHEFGHARAMASYGTAYTYSAALDSNAPTDYAYGIYVEKFLSPSLLFDGAYTQPASLPNFTKVPKPFLARVMGSTPKRFAKLLNTWWKDPTAVDEKNLTSTEKWVLGEFKIDHKAPILASSPIGSDYTSEADVQSIIDKLPNGVALSLKETNIKRLIENDFALPMITAGLNNEMRFTQEISDIIYAKKGHLAYFTPYLIGKFSSHGYVLSYESALAKNKVSPGNDIANILSAYKNRDYSIDGSDIKMGSLASFLLSATTWSFVYSAFTELPKGSFLVHAPVWHGWRLPDVNFYMTTQGLSFEVVTGYQFNENWYAGLTAEMVYKGNTAYEFAPSIGYSFNTSSGEISLSAQAIISNEMEFGGNAGRMDFPQQSLDCGNEVHLPQRPNISG
jgi:hypothetical protein